MPMVVPFILQKDHRRYPICQVTRNPDHGHQRLYSLQRNLRFHGRDDGVMSFQSDYGLFDDGHDAEDPAPVNFNDSQRRCEDANCQVGSADICYQKITRCLQLLPAIHCRHNWDVAKQAYTDDYREEYCCEPEVVNRA